MSSNSELSNMLHETRSFEPPAELAAHANLTAEAYAEAQEDRLAFWGKQAERITWAEPFTEVPTTVWTGTSRTGSATGSPTTSRRRTATSGTSRMPSCSPRCARRPTG